LSNGFKVDSTAAVIIHDSQHTMRQTKVEAA